MTINKNKLPEKAYRTVSLERAEINEEERSLEISFSSEAPVMRWFGPEILVHEKESVNLKRLNEVGTLLFAHGRDGNYGVVPIGGIDKAWLDKDAKTLRAKIHFDPEDDKAERIFKKVKNGDLSGVSFGYSIDFDSIEEVEAGKKSEDGRFKGPAILIKQWEPHEISIEPTPADWTIGVGRNEEFFEGGESQLTEEVKEVVEEKVVEEVEGKAVQESEPVVEEKVKEDPIQEEKSDVAELTRKEVLDIYKLARDVGCFEEKEIESFIEEGRKLEDVRKVALGRMVENRQPVGTRVEVLTDEKDKVRAAASDAFLMRTGVKLDKPAPGFEEFRSFSLLDLAKDCVERKGEKWRGMGKLQIAQRAIFGTDDFPYIMGNIANKTMMKAYEEAPSTYQVWCNIVDGSDFKDMYRNQLSQAPDLDRKYENGEYQNATFSETRETYKILTYGKKFSISREAIINDDMGALTRIPRQFGASAARKVNGLPYAILEDNDDMADGSALFVAGHGNIEGTAANKDVPSVTTLASARAYMRKQTGLGGHGALNLTPRFLIAPPDLEMVSSQLIRSGVDPSKYNNTPNIIVAGSLSLVCDASLSDSDAWYLAADPSQIDTIEVAFLDGNRAPLIESKENWDVDGIEYKVRIDVGAKSIDHRGLFKNVGTS